VQFGGNVDDETHCIEQTAEHQDKRRANSTDGKDQGKECQEHTVAVQQKLNPLSNG